MLPSLPVGSDNESARRLADALTRHRTLSSADVESAEALANQYSAEEALQTLRECVLSEAAAQAVAERRFLEALAYLRHAASLYPTHRAAHIRLLDVLLKKGDWMEAESAARNALSLHSGDVDASIGLAYALMRQDRNDEAARVLEDLGPDEAPPVARALRERLRKIAAQEKALAEERFPHFTLRYDGAVREDVGRRVLDLLEEQYRDLAAIFGHQPLDTVPVILLSNEQYYAQAPEWSGGEFDATDGRIRLPIRGLTEAGVPALGRTLKHELTHVFVADATGRLAPRELQEGIAQYMEGKRLEKAARAANPKYADVHASYRAALSFTEFLIQEGGLATLGFALRETGETGDLEKGFLAAYNRDYRTLEAEWRAKSRPS